MNQEISIKAEHVSKVYHLYNKSIDRLKEAVIPGGKKYHKEYYALKDISFEIKKGETFGIIGANGAGKSTLLKMITGVATPTGGSIQTNGKISALLELGAGFNKDYTGRENIYLNGTMMGFSREEMKDRVESILEFADIGEFIDQPVKTYSSGMFARLAFSVAISVEPEILIVDEALSVGDVFFQNKCYKKFEELRKKNITIIFVSHDIGTVRQMCSRVLWIEHGVQQMVGDSAEVCTLYTNSILEKRGREAKKGNQIEADQSKYQVKHFELENYPEIAYTNDSILSDDVKIISAFILNENGERVSNCMVSRPCTVSIIFESKIDIENCIAGFVVETVKGLWIINCNSMMAGEKKPFQVTKDTYTRVDFQFDMPALSNGDYVVGVAISRGDAVNFEVLTWLYNVLYIQISDSGNLSCILNINPEIDVFHADKENYHE